MKKWTVEENPEVFVTKSYLGLYKNPNQLITFFKKTTIRPIAAITLNKDGDAVYIDELRSILVDILDNDRYTFYKTMPATKTISSILTIGIPNGYMIFNTFVLQDVIHAILLVGTAELLDQIHMEGYPNVSLGCFHYR